VTVKTGKNCYCHRYHHQSEKSKRNLHLCGNRTEGINYANVVETLKDAGIKAAIIGEFLKEPERRRLQYSGCNRYP
jgi:hypothetical protein